MPYVLIRRHAAAGVFAWEKPDEWRVRDEYDFYQREVRETPRHD